jgi:hypothetical protein
MSARRVNHAIKRHLELEIKTVQNTQRDADKLRQLLKSKGGQNEEAMHIEDTQRLVVTKRLKCSGLHCIWCAEIEEGNKT